MCKIRFGPSGNSVKFYEEGYKSSLQAPAWLKSLGLNAYEISFGKGYTMREETAAAIGQKAKENDVLISVHAPYYINLANVSEEMIEKSYNYVLTGLKYLRLFGGKHLVVHLASQGKLEREKALELTSERLDKLIELIYENGYDDMFLCPETMGKSLQIGSWKEIIDFCAKDKILIPTFDFGHIYSLNLGNWGTYEDFKELVNYSIEKIGLERTKQMHVHFSKIMYSGKGEVKHLNLSDEGWGPSFEPFARIIKDFELTPTVICESHSNMSDDALIMKSIYERTIDENN